MFLRIVLLAALSLLVAPLPAQNADPAIFRVMTFNIRNSGAKDGENGWPHRKELYAETIRHFDPDVLGTQEVLADQFDDLQKFFPAYTAVGVARDDGKRKGEWSAIFYRTARFEEIASGNFWLSETPEEVASRSWDAALTRICTWARLRERTSGREMLFANTHFDHKGVVARARSGDLLREKLPQLSGGAPLVLTGDFNCTEDSEAWHALTTGSHALVDSYRAVHPERSPDEASFHAFKGGVEGSRIDWILSSPDFTAVEASIVRGEKGGPYASDHYAVTAILKLKPKP
jgi:endonuclease/exonuclease/phosphatase family metal-dependent hydrolase